eukprot:scaffold330095_cov50-Prasinocladus_malaysianus.AAC.1
MFDAQSLPSDDSSHETWQDNRHRQHSRCFRQWLSARSPSTSWQCAHAGAASLPGAPGTSRVPAELPPLAAASHQVPTARSDANHLL